MGTFLGTEGLDYGLTGEHPVIFEVGETTAAITIPINDDPLIELNEEFYVEIIDGGGGEINTGRKETKVVILNNDGKLNGFALIVTLLKYMFPCRNISTVKYSFIVIFLNHF